MASERIQHAAAAETAASASPTSTAGAADTNGGTEAAAGNDAASAAAVKSTSNANGSGKAKSGNGSNGGKSNTSHQNQHRRKGNNKNHHNYNQHQRQHHQKGGHYNNHHRQHQHQHHQNRPGAYVPVNSPALSMQTPPPPLDLAGRRSGLLQALTPQLEYYFSAANLSGDTYLRTLMDLNSGYVPVAAVATFGNVQRIVMRWDGGIPPTASTSPNPEDPPGGPLVRSEKEGVAGFVAAAARASQTLDVVEINADGKVVRTVCSGGKAKDGGKGEAENKKKEEEKEDSSQGNEAKDKKVRAAAADTRIAIGPAGGGEVSKSTAAASGGTNTNTTKDTPSATSAPAAPVQVQAAPEQTTIILRDAPEATTEKDIRSVFSAAKTTVTNVHPDVGNTWFVSLDAKTTSRDDVVSLLLSLRGMKLHGEPIKARLKTESVAARRGTASGGYGYAASAPQSPVTGRPGQFQQHGAGPMATGTTGGSRAVQSGRGRGGGGMRQPHMGQSRSVPSSPMAGGRHENYGVGKLGGRGGKNIVALGSGTGNKVRRGSRTGDGKATSFSGNTSSPKEAGTTTKASSSAIPPPPLAGLHFPALSGDNGGDDKKSRGQLQHRPKGAPPKDSDDEGSDFAEKPNKDEKAPTLNQPTGGYAAALRKAAPAKAVVGEEKKIAAATSAAVGPDGKALKLPPSTGGQGPSSRVSKSTTLTDDSSADDKSSVSSKPESIESHPAVTPVAPSWGGGNTFADILKKKQQAAAAAAGATTDTAGAEKKKDDKSVEE